MKVFIHVGLPKTGTTFLQECVFKHLPVNYVRYFDKTIYHNCFNFEHPFLLSNEDLSGYPHCLFDDCSNSSRWFIARNLSMLFPDASIIIGIRNIDSWIKSIYKESVRQGLSLTEKQFYKRISYNGNLLNFDVYIRFLKKLFDDVFVYNFEELKHNPTKIIKSLCSFLNIEMPIGIEYKIMNRSLSDNQVRTLRFLNHFFYSKSYNPKGLFNRFWFNIFYRKIRGDIVQ